MEESLLGGTGKKCSDGKRNCRAASDRQSMKAVVESEERYRSLFHSMSEGFLIGRLIRDEEGRPIDFAILEANPACEKLTGYRLDRLVGRKITEIAPADEPAWLRHIGGVVGVDEPVRFEDYSVSIGKWLRIYAYPLHKEDLYAVIFTDTTERKRTEEALQKSEAFLKNVFDSIQDGISVLDKDLNIVRTNHVMEKWHEYMMPLEGKKCYHVYHGRSVPCDICPSMKAIRLKTMQSEIVPFHGENKVERGWLEIYSFPLLDDRGNVTGVIEHVRDITERMRGEEALRNSETRFRALFENAGTAIIIVDDATGAVKDCNSNAEKLFGRPRDEITGMNVLQLHPPEDMEKHHRSIVRRADQGKVVNYEAEALHKDGRKIPVIINATPVMVNGRKIMMGFFLDITERKQAEDSLRESEEKFRVLNETVSAAICILQDGRFQYVNPAMEAITGYTREELMSIDFRNLVHPDSIDYIKARYVSWLAGLSLEGRGTFKGTDKNGTVRWADISRKTINYNGRPAILITGIDITERNRVEEALQRSEERYRQLTESSADFIYIIDREFMVRFVNRSGATALRMSPEDAIGRHLEHLFPPESYLVMKRGLTSVFDTGRPYSSEIVHRFYQGNFYMHVALTPLFDSEGNVNFVMGVSRDINDLKKAEAALRESEEKFRVLAETSPTAICVFRGEQFVYVNPAVERISGYVKEDFLKMKIWDLLTPGCRNRLMDQAKVRKQGNPVPSHFELAFYHKSRETRWVDVTIGPVEIGGTPAYIVSAYDITERRRVEKELLEAKSQAELYLDLMGHDINNMHQMALGYLEIARDAQADESQRALLDKPIEALERSARLIRNVRKLQMLHEGTINAQTIDLCTKLSELQGEYGVAHGKTVTLNLNGHTGCFVLANELLYDVFANLVGNAIKHTDDGASITISLDSRKVGDRLCYAVSVEDDGTGIPDGFKDLVFKRLLKGSTMVKGSGIGLYLVKSLVDSYHGRVWVEDRVPGDHTKGAKFVVVLPAIKQ